MIRLTKAQRLYLAQCGDWVAIFEILERIGKPFNSYSARGVRTSLGLCHKRGLCEWSPTNNTYRTTDKGRKALEYTP